MSNSFLEAIIMLTAEEVEVAERSLGIWPIRQESNAHFPHAFSIKSVGFDPADFSKSRYEIRLSAKENDIDRVRKEAVTGMGVSGNATTAQQGHDEINKPRKEHIDGNQIHPNNSDEDRKTLIKTVENSRNTRPDDKKGKRRQKNPLDVCEKKIQMELLINNED